MKTRKSLLVAIAGCVLGSLALTGCSPLSKLDVIVNTAESAVTLIIAAGVPIPPVVVTAVSNVAQCVATQNGSSNPTQAQLLAISVCLAAQVLPELKGVPPAVANVIVQLFKDIQAFLLQYPPKAIAHTRAVPVSPKDVQHFDGIKRHAATVVHALAAISK